MHKNNVCLRFVLSNALKTETGCHSGRRKWELWVTLLFFGALVTHILVVIIWLLQHFRYLFILMCGHLTFIIQDSATNGTELLLPTKIDFIVMFITFTGILNWHVYNWFVLNWIFLISLHFLQLNLYQNTRSFIHVSYFLFSAFFKLYRSSHCISYPDKPDERERIG
jgi:hypothetical protein